MIVKNRWVLLDRLLALAAAVMGIVSIVLNDADKSPLYFLLAYALGRHTLMQHMPEA